MPIPRFRVTQVGFILGGIAAAALLVSISPTARAGIQSGCPASGPCPTPPTHAYIVLDTAAGGPHTKITVSGYAFPPGSTVSLYWDSPSQRGGIERRRLGWLVHHQRDPVPGQQPWRPPAVWLGGGPEPVAPLRHLHPAGSADANSTVLALSFGLPI